jgi:hypothetical protein
MIEVQHDDVGLAAVDTRMSSKVLADQRPVLDAIPLYPSDFLLDLDLAVPDVVLAAVPRMTGTAAALASALCLAMKCELADWPQQSAVIATLRLD